MRPNLARGTDNPAGISRHTPAADLSSYGEVFARPFPEPLPRWDDEAADGAEFWAAEHESRDDIVGLYRRVWEHSDATIRALPIDAPGYVPWWNQDVMLFNIMVHVLSDTTRHAGHADILREQTDGAVGMLPQSAALHGQDSAFWELRCAAVEQAARAADRSL